MKATNHRLIAAATCLGENGNGSSDRLVGSRARELDLAGSIGPVGRSRLADPNFDAGHGSTPSILEVNLLRLRSREVDVSVDR